MSKKTAATMEEWRKMTSANLIKEMHKQRDELAKISVAISLQKHKDTSEGKKIRHTIARILTVLKERETA